MSFGEQRFENQSIPPTEKPEEVGGKDIITKKKIEPIGEREVSENRKSTEAEDNLKLEQIRGELKKIQEVKEKDPEQEFLRNEIERTSSIAGRFMKVDQVRKDSRLDPLFELNYPEQYIKDFIPVRSPDDQKLTKEDLHHVENKTLGFTLEVADQILQPKPRQMGIRENPESLKEVYATLKRGEQLLIDMQEKRPEDTEILLKQRLTERKGVPEERIKPEQIKQLEASISNARGYMARRIASLERYFGR